MVRGVRFELNTYNFSKYPLSNHLKVTSSSYWGIFLHTYLVFLRSLIHQEETGQTATMTDEKLPPTTSSSSSSTMHEKSDAEQAAMAREAMKTDESGVKVLESAPSIHEGDNDNPIELKKTKSAAEIQQEDLKRVMTSPDGIEYPTGVKLQLISLALCLSVFLMALVSFL